MQFTQTEDQVAYRTRIKLKPIKPSTKYARLQTLPDYCQLVRHLNGVIAKLGNPNESKCVELRNYTFCKLILDKLAILPFKDFGLQIKSIKILLRCVKVLLSEREQPKQRIVRSVGELLQQVSKQKVLIKSGFKTPAESQIKLYKRHLIGKSKKLREQMQLRKNAITGSAFPVSKKEAFFITEAGHALTKAAEQRIMTSVDRRLTNSMQRQIQEEKEHHINMQTLACWSDEHTNILEQKLFCRTSCENFRVSAPALKREAVSYQGYEEYLTLLEGRPGSQSRDKKQKTVNALNPFEQARINSTKQFDQQIKSFRFLMVRRKNVSPTQQFTLSTSGPGGRFGEQRRQEQEREIKEIDDLKEEIVRKRLKISYQTLKRGIYSGGVNSRTELKGLATGLMDNPLPDKDRRVQRKVVRSKIGQEAAVSHEMVGRSQRVN